MTATSQTGEPKALSFRSDSRASLTSSRAEVVIVPTRPSRADAFSSRTGSGVRHNTLYGWFFSRAEARNCIMLTLA
jgi:hypothetical protein